MSEYLYPFRGSTAQRLLDLKATLINEGIEDKFHDDEAIHDLMLADDRGRERTLQQWADRWGWGKTTVYRKIDDLRRTAEFQRDFRDAEGRKLGSRGVEHRGTEVEHRGTAVEQQWNEKRPSERSEGDSGTEVERSWNEGGTARNEGGTAFPYTSRAQQTQTTDTEVKGNPDGLPRMVENPDSDADDDPPPPDDSPFASGPDLSDWHIEFARGALSHMRRLQVLSKNVEKKLKRDEEKVLADWAHVIRLLEEQDGWTRKEIGRALQWLFRKPNEWIQNRWIQSLSSLRKTTRTGDRTRFEAIYNQAQTDDKRRKDQGFDDPAASHDRIRRAAEAALGDG